MMFRRKKVKIDLEMAKRISKIIDAYYLTNVGCFTSQKSEDEVLETCKFLHEVTGCRKSKS